MSAHHTATRATIRPLRRDDIADLQALDAAAHGEAWSHALYVDQIEQRQFLHLVAVDTAGALLGHAATWRDGDPLRLINLAIVESARGTGVATELLLALFAHTSDVQSIDLEVRPSNRSAQRLYARFGFAPVGVERNFYERADATGSRDAMVMRVDDPASVAWRERVDRIAQALREGAAA